MTASGPPVVLRDPRAIRALAHPARLAVIDELYGDRSELTATECAELAGLTPSAMSYHLRSLEKAGIVERAPATGDGRERPWRAAGAYLQVQSDSDVAEEAAFVTLLLSRLGEQFGAWRARQHDEPAEWREAAIVTSSSVWMRADELAELDQLVRGKLDEYRNRAEHPDGSRRVRISFFGLPILPARNTAEPDDRLDRKEDPAT